MHLSKYFSGARVFLCVPCVVVCGCECALCVHASVCVGLLGARALGARAPGGGLIGAGALGARASAHIQVLFTCLWITVHCVLHTACSTWISM